MEFLHEKAQAMITPVEERPELQKLEDLFLSSLPEVTIRLPSSLAAARAKSRTQSGISLISKSNMKFLSTTST